MMKSMIAATLAGALAFGSAAQPVAAADRGETTRTILGIAALAALGIAIANSNKGGSAPVSRDDHHRDDWRHPAALPGYCAFDIRTQQGNRRVLGKSCLDQAGYWRVPSACGFDIRTHQGLRQVYGAQCLERNGYRIEARR